MLILINIFIQDMVSDFQSLFSIPHLYWGKNVYVLGVYMSSSVHIDNKGKDILILSKGPTQGLNSTTLTAEAAYSINFFRSQRKFCLSFLYNGNNSFLFVNATNIYQFKVKDSEKKISLAFRKYSKRFY